MVRVHGNCRPIYNREHEFTLHQFTILPGGAAEKFRITEFEKIEIV